MFLYIVIKIINSEIFHKVNRPSKSKITVLALALTLLPYVAPLNNFVQPTSADSISDAIDNFRDRGNNDNIDNNAETNDEIGTSDSRRDRISDAISQFTIRGNNFERFGNIFQNNPSEPYSEEQEGNAEQNGPSTCAFNPGSILDGIGSSTSNQFNTFRSIFSPFLQGFPDGQDEFDDSLDNADERVSDALERAKHRISGSLPSGVGFN
jgi:hypothetical protein